jgi:hypothetical protein
MVSTVYCVSFVSLLAGFVMCVYGYAQRNFEKRRNFSQENMVAIMGFLLFIFGGMYGGCVAHAFAKSARDRAAESVKLFLLRRNEAYAPYRVWWQIVPDHFTDIISSSYSPIRLSTFKIEIIDQAPKARGGSRRRNSLSEMSLSGAHAMSPHPATPSSNLLFGTGNIWGTKEEDRKLVADRLSENNESKGTK